MSRSEYIAISRIPVVINLAQIFSLSTTKQLFLKGEKLKSVIILAMFFLFMGCSIEYTYKITGTADSAIVTYTNKSGDISQETSASIPWKKTLTGYVGDAVSVSAQNLSDTGTIAVEIWKEGSLFKTSDSRGPYCVSSASGTL